MPNPAAGGKSAENAATNTTPTLKSRSKTGRLWLQTAVLAVEAAIRSWAVPVKWITPPDALIFREPWLASCLFQNDPCDH